MFYITFAADDTGALKAIDESLAFIKDKYK